MRHALVPCEAPNRSKASSTLGLGPAIITEHVRYTREIRRFQVESSTQPVTLRAERLCIAHSNRPLHSFEVRQAMLRNVQVRIASVNFENFKAFEQFALSLDSMNILVGPNNSGKSTIIGAFRALDSAVKVARSRPPSRIFLGSRYQIGYWIPEDSLPISLENVHTNYNSSTSKITFRLSNGNTLQLIFPEDGGCAL
jgi:hypothetical protein